MGVALSCALLGLSGFGAGCGDDKSAGDNETVVDAGGDSEDGGGSTGGPAAAACDPEKLPAVPDNGIAYPDSYCGPDGCVAGACDPLARCGSGCNAWAFAGKVSFQAITVADSGTLGAQAAPTAKDGEDVCPANMVSSDGPMNCCQRGDNSKVTTPAFKLTSLTMSQPLYFAIPVVTGVNKAAIETDLYNWVTVLSSKEDGSVTARSGNALPNVDNTWTSVKGPFKLGGESFNAKGVWDAHTDIPAALSTEGSVRKLTLGPTSSAKDYVMVIWMDSAYDFARLQLHMRGVKLELPLDADLNCGGERTPGQFEQVGTLTGFIPVDAASKTEVFISRQGSQNLCTSTSGAADCSLPVPKWKPAS